MSYFPFQNTLPANRQRAFNERKKEVLKCVHDWGSVTSSELAGKLNIEIHNAGMLLLKYHRQGLLDRGSNPQSTSGGRIYTLSEKGANRLQWLIWGEEGDADGVLKDAPTGFPRQTQGQIPSFISVQECQRITKEKVAEAVKEQDRDTQMRELAEAVDGLVEAVEKLSNGEYGEWSQQGGNFAIIEEFGPDGRIVRRRRVPESQLQFENAIQIIKFMKTQASPPLTFEDARRIAAEYAPGGPLYRTTRGYKERQKRKLKAKIEALEAQLIERERIILQNELQERISKFLHCGWRKTGDDEGEFVKREPVKVMMPLAEEGLASRLPSELVSER